MKKLILKIYGMDCAEEVGILKRELKSFIEKEEDLTFDLINEKLTIDYDDEKFTSDQMIQQILKTGMKAVAWQTYIKQQLKTKSFWPRYGRIIAVLISALGLFLGFFFHAAHHAGRVILSKLFNPFFTFRSARLSFFDHADNS